MEKTGYRVENRAPIRADEKKPASRQENPKPTRYETGMDTIDNFGKQHLGKSVTVTLRSGRVESGILRGYGQYDIALELSNKKILFVMKHAIDVVVVL